MKFAYAMVVLLGLIFSPAMAQPYDRVISLADNTTNTIDASGERGGLIELFRSLDKVTLSTSKIVMRPFARSLKETAEAKADLHAPFIQVDGTPAPEGLAYVTEVAIGKRAFVIYSRKTNPITAQMLERNNSVLVERGHALMFPFSVTEVTCVPCGLDMVTAARADAIIVANDIVDPLLRDPKYKGIHRSLYKIYTVRALVPANVDSSAVRRYLTEGFDRLKKNGELPKENLAFSEWQP